jgi:hypothetical protein
MLDRRIDGGAQTEERQRGKDGDEMRTLSSSFPGVLCRAKSSIGSVEAPPYPHSQDDGGQDVTGSESNGGVAIEQLEGNRNPRNPDSMCLLDLRLELNRRHGDHLRARQVRCALIAMTYIEIFRMEGRRSG